MHDFEDPIFLYKNPQKLSLSSFEIFNISAYGGSAGERAQIDTVIKTGPWSGDNPAVWKK